MTSDSPRPVLDRSDFDLCFVDEPTDVAPTLVLLAARRSLRWRRLVISFVMVLAALIIGLLTVSILTHTSGMVPRPDTALPSPPPMASQLPDPDRTQPSISPPNPVPKASGKDRAPELVWRTQGGYRDQAGLTADDEQGDPFELTSRTLSVAITEQLDPSRQHLRGGGLSTGTDGKSVEVGQRFTWEIPGEPGMGSLQVAVTRLAPKARVAFEDGNEGLCSNTRAQCAFARVSGVEVWTAVLPLNGYAIDLVQEDGELASIIVMARANDSTVPLSELPITPEQAVNLLRNHNLDVVG